MTLDNSGAPLLCQQCKGCSWYVAGLILLRSRCGQLQGYDVYTNVTTYESWIQNVTNIRGNSITLKLHACTKTVCFFISLLLLFRKQHACIGQKS